MHPLLNQQMAQNHREEIQREIRAAHLANCLCVSRRGKYDRFFSHALLWYLLLGLREPVYTNEWEDALGLFEERLAVMSRVIGMAALGFGLLTGSFLSVGPGMFLAVLPGALLCAIVSLPILARMFMLLWRR
jgi:hypothetical protein